MSYKTILPKQFIREVDNSVNDYNTEALKSMDENIEWILGMCLKTSQFSVIYTDRVKNCHTVVVDNRIDKVVALYLNNKKVLEPCIK